MESAREAPNVMVVDDELGFRDLMKFELTPRGYKIITAADGEEALAKARSANVSVVISDMTMPKLGGLDLLAALKACDPAIEVIIVTGFAT
ncbi:MAG: response regulator, partial [Elusimicrobia bacterium]|nr:response regulator [Elusimicrobiota bacterium]